MEKKYCDLGTCRKSWKSIDNRHLFSTLNETNTGTEKVYNKVSESNENMNLQIRLTKKENRIDTDIVQFTLFSNRLF